ncbi:DUF58 domain-containing protein [Tropicimonas sp. S265A]|uniref:DUF58 domain-containing protein n=1 Tax=Tropicimonas sp. S265A TaxID=3415134 RepID=UPI003C7E297C
MSNRAARSRTGTLAATQDRGTDTRVRVTLDHLRSLEPRASGLRFLPRQPARSVLNGRHASRLRGRGLNFEELRDYLPGDDPRSIDWKVTARTGTPHVRVMTEERDRPALLVVDQRMTMFFGTTRNMKSVTAAEAAALVAFRILAQGDRVGGLVFGDDTLAEIRPQRSRAAVMRLLTSMLAAQDMLRADAPMVAPMSLTRVLRATARIAPRDHLIVVLSDFDQIEDETDRLIAGLARRNDLILGLITDPSAHEMPENMRLVVSDGTLQAQIDTGADTTRTALRAFSEGRLAQVLDWQRRFGVPVLPLSSGADTLEQVRHLMGLAPR